MTKSLDLRFSTPCAACPLRALDVVFSKKPQDIAFIQQLKIGERRVRPGASIIDEHAKSEHLYTLLSGWAFRFKTFDDGRRQITDYATPGDLIGLQAALFGEMTHGVEALTDTVLCVFPREKFWSLFEKDASLAFDVTWLGAHAEVALERQLLSIGRRRAVERAAYLLWYVFDKARDIGLVKNDRLALPMTQIHLADTLGLSIVHTNKTLQLLRERKIVTLDDRQLAVHDEPALRQLGKVEDLADAGRPLI